MDIDAEVARLKDAAAAAQQRHARAEAGAVVAEGRAAAVIEELRTEFGVGTLEEARKLLAQLGQQVEARSAEVRRLLAQAGAPQ